MTKLIALLVLLTAGCATPDCGRPRHDIAKAVRREAREALRDVTPHNAYQRKVLAMSVIPGGGWVYMENTGHERGWDVSPGVPFFLATVAGALVVANNTNDWRVLAVGVPALFVVRFDDVRWSMLWAKRGKK